MVVILRIVIEVLGIVLVVLGIVIVILEGVKYQSWCLGLLMLWCTLNAGYVEHKQDGYP